MLCVLPCVLSSCLLVCVMNHNVCACGQKWLSTVSWRVPSLLCVCIWFLKWFSKQKCQHYKPELSRPICATLTVPDMTNIFSRMHLIWQFDCACDESQYTTQPHLRASGRSDQLYLLWRQTAEHSHTSPHFIRVLFDFTWVVRFQWDTWGNYDQKDLGKNWKRQKRKTWLCDRKNVI